MTWPASHAPTWALQAKEWVEDSQPLPLALAEASCLCAVVAILMQVKELGEDSQAALFHGIRLGMALTGAPLFSGAWFIGFAGRGVLAGCCEYLVGMLVFRGIHRGMALTGAPVCFVLFVVLALSRSQGRELGQGHAAAMASHCCFLTGQPLQPLLRMQPRATQRRASRYWRRGWEWLRTTTTRRQGGR